MSAVEIVPGQHYRLTFEGVGYEGSFGPCVDMGNGLRMGSRTLDVAVSVEPIPTPLPTTRGSVIRFLGYNGMTYVAHLRRNGTWQDDDDTWQDDDDKHEWSLSDLLERNPTVIFDAGASS
jgi:hypothetical protein